MVRTRFAPSPTGYLHIGGVRTALFNYLFAKQNNGHFILRIDDTDNQRNVEAALQPILDGFEWLGLNWDEGPQVGGPHEPYFQSQRSELHQAAAKTLLDSGHAYKDYSTTEELQQLRQEADKSGQQFLYDRRWMATSDEQAAAWEAENRQAVVRLKMPREGVCKFTDLVRGEVEFQWSGEADHVIQRADGGCLYHLASVVDDHDLQITHVIRAVEHLSNTPRQIYIAQSLGYELPQFAHLPYVAEPNGTAKLSKRKLDKYMKDQSFAGLNKLGADISELTKTKITAESFNPVVVDFYRETGFLPAAILNYLLMLGWSLDDSAEDFSLEQAIADFSLDRVHKSPASFDPAKLLAVQSRWMARQTVEDKVEMIVPLLEQAGWVDSPITTAQRKRLSRIVELAGERIRIAGDIFQFDELFIADDKLPIDETLRKKRASDIYCFELMQEYAERLSDKKLDNAELIETDLQEFMTQRNVKFGLLMNALRVSMTGKSTGLAVFEYMELLGPDSVSARIKRIIAMGEKDLT